MEILVLEKLVSTLQTIVLMSAVFSLIFSIALIGGYFKKKLRGK